MEYNLLLVDDEENVVRGLQRSLRKEPYTVHTANSGADALEILQQQDIDVIVSDERMPGMTGAEFLAEAKQRYPETIRIMLSGQADLDAVVKAVNDGEIYRFLFKPCQAEELITTINQALKHKELLDRSRWLLAEYKKQADIIDRLEDAQVGVTKVKRDEDGAVLITTEPLSLDEILEELKAEMSATG